MSFAPSNPSQFHQGKYKIINVMKYLSNPDDIVYRSSWEFKFMRYCDLNSGVLKWGSEIYKVSYIDFAGKQRTYIPDFYLETSGGRFLVEVKPEKETKEPEIPKGNISPKKMKNIEYECAVWIKNKHKWAFATEWCKKRDIEFKIVTEHYINRLQP